MTPEQLAALAADDERRELHVTPRYLAGSGPEPEIAIEPLLTAGFTAHQADFGCFLYSPCHRVRAAFLPEGDDAGLWHFTASRLPMHPPVWKAVFDDGIPFEAIAAFAEALAHSVTADLDGEEPELFLRTTPWVAQVLEPLQTASWKPPRDASARLASPGDLARLHLADHQVPYAKDMGRGPHSWNFEVGRGGAAAHVSFTAETPVHLIKAFATSLVDPTPVVRTRRQLPTRFLKHLTVVEQEVDRSLAAARLLSAGAESSTGLGTGTGPIPQPPEQRPDRRIR